MTPFHVGMKVVCVADDIFRGAGYGGERLPTNHQVYTIRDMIPSPTRLGFFALRLDEIRNDAKIYLAGDKIVADECAFADIAFRPAHENRMDELRTLLAPVPSKQIAQAKKARLR